MNYRQEADRGLHAEGCFDAGTGQPPANLLDSYLDGYFKTLRERVEQGENLEISFRSPHRDQPVITSISYDPGYDKYVNYREEF